MVQSESHQVTGLDETYGNKIGQISSLYRPEMAPEVASSGQFRPKSNVRDVYERPLNSSLICFNDYFI